MIVPAWLTGVLLAAAVVPPLLLLYFLKLRRKTQPIASTLLWKRSVEDLRANAPFQRLRWNVLLLLQLLVLGMLAMAVMQPQLQAAGGAGDRIVLLIDNSASMTASDVAENGPAGVATRLDLAKRQARERIEKLYAGGLFSRAPGETMIMAFSDRAEILCRFTTSKQQLLSAIDDIEPTHGGTRIADALKLARAYTTNVDPENPRPVGAPALLELYSDGRIEDLADQVLRGERMLYHPIGTATNDNVAIGAMAVERPYDQPTAVQVFVALLNFSAEPAACTLQLAVNGDVLLGGLEDIRVHSAAVDSSTGRLAPGRYNLTFKPFDQPRDAVIEVRNLRPDALEADNVARVVVPPARKLRVALVGSRSFVLPTVLEGLALEQLRRFTADQLADLATSGAGQQERFDVIVLDNVAATTLSPGRYLSFGATPPIDGLNDYGVKDGLQLFLQTRENHPLLRFVDLSDVVFDKARLLRPADDVMVLAEGSAGTPAIIEVRRGPLHDLHCVFDLLDSNFPANRSFPTFVFNAIDYLGHAGDSLASQSISPGEAITISLPSAAMDIAIKPPTGATERILTATPAAVSWGPTKTTGLYQLTWKQPDVNEPLSRPFAVNLFSETEGDVAVRPQIALSQHAVETVSSDSTYRALWPWAVGLSLLVLMLEWWIYQRRSAV